MTSERSRDALVLLAMRVAIGAMLVVYHVVPKIQHFDEEASWFPDPLGIGGASQLVLVMAGELAGALGLALGAMTRASALVVIALMAGVVAIALAGVPQADVQLALLYALVCAGLAWSGPGPLSVDAWWASRRGVPARA